MSSRRLEAGTVVAGKYQLLERLGGGGMGEVYRAEHQLAGRTVAVKFLRADFAEDSELTRRFFQEAQAANKIRHPNIVDVLDAGFSEHGPYVVMECLEGLSLSAALAKMGKLGATTALAIILPMLDALDAAHRHGIVHRDLKPENVFLARVAGAHGASSVRVKLLDFGIAKVLDTSDGQASPRTRTGTIYGTPDYLSPEQATGEGIIDGRSDVFAVGIVLFELLTGKRPFTADSAIATAYKIVHAAPPTLAAMGLKVDPHLQDALDLALAKKPEARFATAASFADMLAPMVPDGASRRESLKSLVDQAVRMVSGAPTAEPAQGGVVVRPPRKKGARTSSLGNMRAVSEVGPTERPPPMVDAPSAIAESVSPPATNAAPDASLLASAEEAPPPAEVPPAPPVPTPTLASSPLPPAKPDPPATPYGFARRDVPSGRSDAGGATISERRGEARPSSPKPETPAVPPARKSRPSAVPPALTPARPRAAAPPPDLPPQRPRMGSVPDAPPPPRARMGSVPEISPTNTPGKGMFVWPTLAPPPLASPRAAVDTPGRAPPRFTVTKNWSPRPLPAAVRGKCHTRGTLLRAVGRWLERAFGEAGRDAVFSMIRKDYAETFRTDGFNALVWYDLDALDMLMEAAASALMGGDVAQWRGLARDNFEKDLAPVFRPTQRVADAESLVKRASAAWARIYDFGTVRVGDAHGGRLPVRVDGFEAASLAIRYATVGTVEAMLKSGGFSGTSVRIIAGEASFARDFEYEIGLGSKGAFF